MQTTQQVSSDHTFSRINQQLGYVPLVFSAFQNTPPMLDYFWHQSLIGYYGNPLPALFKEKVLVYISRAMGLSYSLIYHSCILRALGMRASEIKQFILSIVPDHTEFEQSMQLLKQARPIFTDSQELEASIERCLLNCAASFFFMPWFDERYGKELRLILGRPYYEHLITFLAYIKLYLFCVESHPELDYTEDKRVREHLGALLSDEPVLADVFYNCRQASNKKQEGREAQLLAQIAEQQQTIGELRKKEHILREANNRMDEILSIASHELRSPLTAIKGNLQLALRRLKTIVPQETLQTNEQEESPLATAQELLERAERQLTFLNRLVGDMLDMSRIQTDKLEIFRDICNLADVVTQIVEDQRSLTSARKLCLILPPVEVVPVLVDADRIGQVITNFLNNALKYSRVDQPVEVRLEVNTNDVRVLVRDEGPGIPVEEQEHIWERFYRVSGIRALSGSQVGLGLGLYICKTIIERHQGTVGVMSTPGAGSTFWFTLPLSPADLEDLTGEECNPTPD